MNRKFFYTGDIINNEKKLKQAIIEDLKKAEQEELAKNHKRGIFRVTKTEKPFSGTGRNDLCPCGSGKKYKNCCGR